MSSEGYWWLALALGLVVAVVAIALLQVLLLQVRRVERAADEVWLAGKQVAGHTANTWTLNEVVLELDLLTDEAGSNGGGSR